MKNENKKNDEKIHGRDERARNIDWEWIGKGFGGLVKSEVNHDQAAEKKDVEIHSFPRLTVRSTHTNKNTSTMEYFSVSKSTDSIF